MPQITYLGFFCNNKSFKRTVNNPQELQAFIGELQIAALGAGANMFAIVQDPGLPSGGGELIDLGGERRLRRLKRLRW
jgi:hypothetical protein